MPEKNAPSAAISDSDALYGHIMNALEASLFEGMWDKLITLHCADAAQLLGRLDDGTLDAFSQAHAEIFSADIIVEMEKAKQERVLAQLDNEDIARILGHLDSDDATALLSLAHESRILAILDTISPVNRAHLLDGLAFPENSAGRLMQREFIAVPGFWTIARSLDHIKTEITTRPKIFYEVYVIDPSHHILGVVQLSDLVSTNPDMTLREIMHPLLSDIVVTQDQEDVAFQFRKYSLASAPVKDEKGRLTGMITVDDMVHVLNEEHSEDLLALSNVTAQKKRGVIPDVQGRLPWLMMNLLTAIGVSGVISLFEETLDAIVFLAILMPIIAVIGGNAGNQALAVAIRDMSEKNLEGRRITRAIRREFLIALLNGLLIGVFLGAVSFAWRGDIVISAIITVSMSVTILLAGIFGILIPLGLRKLGADPAIASSVFVLSLTDLVAFFSFLGLASVILM